MPELPEVETVLSGLAKHIKLQKIKSVELRYPGLVLAPRQASISTLLLGDAFNKFERLGKYMKLTTKRGTRLVVHLRMTGQMFLTDKTYQPDKHVHLILTFANGQRLIYRDIRKFGRWIIVPANKQFEDYINAGPDALTISVAEVKDLINKSPKRHLKALLLDQTALAGIGNIYADEICYGLGFDPELPAGKADPVKLTSMIQKVLKLAIKHKGTSVSDYLTSTGARGNFQNLLSVYKQSKCKKCGGVIQKKKVAGRTSHYCPNCQRI